MVNSFWPPEPPLDPPNDVVCPRCRVVAGGEDDPDPTCGLCEGQGRVDTRTAYRWLDLEVTRD